MNFNFHDYSFDTKLASIGELNWMPWVGNNFSKQRILLIGDSSYEDGDGWLDDRNAIRHFVNNQGLNSHVPAYSNRRLFQSIEKTLLQKSQTNYEERNELWSSVAFLNLSQRKLDSRAQRPTDLDFDMGWNAILKVVEILRPAVCVKFGIAGVGRLGYKLANENPGWKFDKMEFYQRPYVINLSRDNFALKILFTNHPTGSRGYNYKKWASILRQVFPAHTNQ